MPVVLLVRHGQASFGADDYDVLSEVGRRQGEVVGAELARRALRDPVAVAGTLRRQQGTAALALPGAELRIDPRWDEYDSRDLLDRYPAQDGPRAHDGAGHDSTGHDGTSRGLQVLLDAALGRWVDDVDGTWPGFSGGATAALGDLVAGLPSGRDAVVFTSGGIVAAVCADLLGTGSAGVVALHRVTANGAITKLVVGRGGLSLISFNDHAHFEGADRGLLTYR